MNNNLLGILQQMANEHGEEILNNPRRVQGLLADMAAREPKAERKALGKCFEMGFYSELKNANEPEQHKIMLVNRLNYEEGFAPELCEGSVAIISALLYAQHPKSETSVEGKQKNLCHGCGKKLQPEWKLCPYCGVAQGKEQPGQLQQPKQPTSFTQPKSSVKSAAQVSVPPQNVPSEEEDIRGRIGCAFLLISAVLAVVLFILFSISGL
jgi:hypothetical protein